jgi:hypothetical protein
MVDTPNKRCFVIAPIGDPDSEHRRRSDQILKYVIHPADKECGYDDRVRADHMSEQRWPRNQPAGRQPAG